ncbi:MAG TPA: CHAT domain-containing tetratricopeptide repeat protein [Thermoanaerobaculia bacterium]|nr:CHAT domain-containing tetratricopeptide repeat protein [Thermoanaerobaculia bacterium]
MIRVAPFLIAFSAASLLGAQPRDLPFPATVVDSLQSGEEAVFTATVPAGRVMTVRLEQQGIDATLTLTLGEEVIDRSNLSAGNTGEEEVVAPASPHPVEYRIVVRSSLPTAECGWFALRREDENDGPRAAQEIEARRALLAGMTLRGKGDAVSLHDAVSSLDKAIAAGDAAGDAHVVAEALYQSALALEATADLERATERFTRALAMFDAVGPAARSARSMDCLGRIARATGNVAEAVAWFGRALPAARAADDPETEADVLNNHGLTLSETGRWAEAVAMFTDAIPIAQRVRSLDVEAALHHNIGQAYGSMGDYPRSLEAYARALEVKRKMNIPRRTAATLNNMARIYLVQGDAAKALETINEALRLWKLGGDRSGYGSSMSMLSRIQQFRGDLDAAGAAAKESTELLRAVGERKGAAASLCNLASIEIERGAFASAIGHVRESLALSREVDDRAQEARSLLTIAKALRATGRIDEALSAAEQAVTIVESLREGIVTPDLRSSYLGTVLEYFDLYIDLLMTKDARSPGRGFAAAAFRVNEQSRARTLLESLARSGDIDSGVDPALLRTIREIRQQLLAKQAYRAQLLRRGVAGAQLAAAEHEIAELAGRSRAVEQDIRAKDPRYAALEFPEPVTVAEVQHRLLSPRTVLVEYHLGAERSYVWVISHDRLWTRVLPGEHRIDDLARTYHRLLSRDPLSMTPHQAANGARALRRTGAALWRMVIGPISTQIAGREIVLAPDGGLYYVPFSTLIEPDGEPMIVRHEIVSIPSATSLDAFRRQPPAPHDERAVAVFADPVFERSDDRFGSDAVAESAGTTQSRDRDGQRSGSFHRLLFAREEADGILQDADRNESLEATGFDAARHTVLNADLRRFGIVHFATHGVIDSEVPELSGLVLSQYDRSGRKIDGFLRPADIYGLDLHADLVVLSACRTALGKEMYGEGLIGLTRGFMYAGANRVVASVWSVDDRATSNLMRRFYEAMLRDKQKPAAALRTAQLAMLRDPRWNQPYYWAAFIIEGD